MGLKQDVHQIFTALPKSQENSENITGVNAFCLPMRSRKFIQMSAVYLHRMCVFCNSKASAPQACRNTFQVWAESKPDPAVVSSHGICAGVSLGVAVCKPKNIFTLAP